MSTINGEFRTRVAYAHVHEPSKYGHFETNIEVTPEIEKKLVELRLDKKIKSGKDALFNGGKYLALRTAQIDRSGTTSSMVVVDANGQPMTELVGNGSECIVFWRAYDDKQYGRVIKFGKMIDWDQEGKSKKFAGLKVVSLVPYQKTDTFFSPMDSASAPVTATADSRNVEFELED
jgi:hypothetical protein